MQSNNNRCRARDVLIAASAVCLALVSGLSAEEPSKLDRLSAMICERLHGSGEANAELIAKAVDAIHLSDSCSSGTTCFRAAQKRVADFSVFIVAVENTDFPSGHKELSSEVNALLKDLVETTGLDARLETPKTLDLLAFVAIDESTFPDNRTAYMENIIAPESLGYSELRTKTFDNWLKSDLACRYVRTAYEDGGIQDAQIWLKTGHDAAETRFCLARSSLLALGLNQLQADGNPQPKADSPYSDSDLFHLRLLYSQLVAPGQSKSETEIALQMFFESECKE